VRFLVVLLVACGGKVDDGPIPDGAPYFRCFNKICSEEQYCFHNEWYDPNNGKHHQTSGSVECRDLPVPVDTCTYHCMCRGWEGKPSHCWKGP
jgi:hypothetical protein